MEYTLLGQTGLRVSRITMGTATFGVAPQERDAVRLVHRAVDLGINFFDTANSYGNQPRFDRPGAPAAEQRRASEEILGEAVKGRRHEVVIASKVMERVEPGPNGGGPDGGGLTRTHIMRMIDRTLQRLQTDYLDIYYMHHPDPTTPFEVSLRAFDDLIRAGKVRYAALSTFPAWQLVEAHWICERYNLDKPTVHQTSYSLASRAIERDVVPVMAKLGYSGTIFSPLHGGLLTGMAATQRSISGTQRWRSGEGPGYGPEETETAQRMDALGAEWGLPPAHIALAWLLSRPTIASAIVGPENEQELEENAAAADVRLTPEQIEVLQDVGANVPPMFGRR